MFTALLVIYVVLAIVVILSILVQSGKGSDISGMFGGGSTQSLLGTGGTQTVMAKITTGLFVAFAVISMILALMPSQKGKSALKKNLQKQTQQVPSPPK